MANERRRALAGVLAPLVENPSRVGVFCDFDGSLAPIVDDPRSARPVRGVPRVLDKLARRFGLVAVVSGRPVSFLVDRLHARSVRLVGLYGVEERIGRRLEVLPEAQSARASVDRAVARLEQELAGEKGIWVEHKGFSLSVHARRSADPPAAMDRIEPIVRAAAEDEGLSALTRGRLVLEAGPRVAVDKGEVVRRLVEDKALTGALVVGDDVGDIPMFQAVEDLVPRIRVSVTSGEGPPELDRLADWKAQGPQDLLRLLKTLASLRAR